MMGPGCTYRAASVSERVAGQFPSSAIYPFATRSLTVAALKGIYDCRSAYLVSGGLFDALDHQGLNRAFSRFQLEPELLLHRRKYGRA